MIVSLLSEMGHADRTQDLCLTSDMSCLQITIIFPRCPFVCLVCASYVLSVRMSCLPTYTVRMSCLQTYTSLVRQKRSYVLSAQDSLTKFSHTCERILSHICVRIVSHIYVQYAHTYCTYICETIRQYASVLYVHM